MKKLFHFVFWTIVVLLIINIFWWGIYNGSGHKIPEKTNLIFRNNSVVLIFMALIFYMLKRKS